MMWSKLSILALSALSSLAAGYADPGACSGTCTNTHDPSIIRRSDGTYFRFSTGGLVQIHTAPDISGPWTFACTMLESAAKVQVSGNPGTDLWAPDVSLVGSTYYVYYSVSSFGTQVSGIGLATSSDMSCGSWSDKGSVGVASTTGKAYNAIDANLLNDGGTYRLTFGSFWNNLYQVSMKNPPTGVASGASSVQLAYEPAGTHPEEGATLIKRGSYYYLFFSYGICCGYDASRPAAGTEYKVKVCRSTSATGGFVDKSGKSCTSGGGTIVLESHGNVYGPGGQSVYNDPENGWIIVYHYVDTTVGYADGQKRFGWNKISWSGGWPTV
ncbi:putative glycoside hydrolase, family 43 [Septoria linicola]|nr:putative glycoside hydrolase, family 43 [Septoria linicola]